MLRGKRRIVAHGVLSLHQLLTGALVVGGKLHGFLQEADGLIIAPDGAVIHGSGYEGIREAVLDEALLFFCLRSNGQHSQRVAIMLHGIGEALGHIGVASLLHLLHRITQRHVTARALRRRK